MNQFKQYVMSVFAVMVITLCALVSVYFSSPLTTPGKVANTALTIVLMVSYLVSCVTAHRIVKELPAISAQYKFLHIDIAFIRYIFANFGAVMFMIVLFDFLALWVPYH